MRTTITSFLILCGVLSSLYGQTVYSAPKEELTADERQYFEQRKAAVLQNNQNYHPVPAHIRALSGNDCILAETICPNDPISFLPSGPGMDDFATAANSEGCLSGGEAQSAWYYFEFESDLPPGTTLTFSINGGGADWDFALYGPDVECDALGSPIRCSFSANGTTGLNATSTDLTEGAGGDGFVAQLLPQPGEGYYLLVNNYSANNQTFNMNWGGTSQPFIDCDANPLCEVDVVVSGPATGCSGESISLTGSLTGGTSPSGFWTSTPPDAAVFINPPNNPNATLTLPPGGISGTYTFTFSAVDVDGCMDDDSFTMDIFEAPASPDTATLFSCNVNGINGLFDLTGVESTIYSGPGSIVWTTISGQSINNPGAYSSFGGVVLATANNNGCESIPTPINLVVQNPDPPVVTCGNETGSTIDFSWTDTGAASYEVVVEVDGVVVSTTSVTGTTFTVDNLPPGAMVTVLVSGEYPAPCANSLPGSATCTTVSCPSITPSISGLDPEYCESDGPVTLSGTPAGGTFSGSGVTGNTFNPSGLSGVVTITYDYTDPATGCTYDTDAVTVVVPETPSPIVNCGSITTSSVTFSWTGTGPFEYTVTIDGVAQAPVTTNDNSVVIDNLPESTPVSITIVAQGSAPCGDSAPASANCATDGCPTIVPVINMQDSYCSDEPPFTISATPAGGTFSGDGVSGNSFDAGAVGGSTATITYDYTDPATGCDYQVSKIVTLIAPPQQPSVTCGNSSTDGVIFNWTGTGSSFEVSYSINGGPSQTTTVNGTTFPVTGLSPGDLVDITVIAPGNTPCADSAPGTASCSADNCPPTTPTISGLDAEYCADNAPVTLSATPGGGTFSGTGVSGNSFDPGAASGPVTITYDYTDPASGCDFSATATTTVVQPPVVPTVNCGPSTPNSVIFGWTPSNPGGYEVIYTINGSGQTTQTTSDQDLEITGLNPNDEVTIIVVALGTAPCADSAPASQMCQADDCPTVTPSINGLASEYCQDDASVTLQATPAGGTFSGNGVSGNSFDPTSLPPGPAVINYDYTDPANGCSYSTSETINIVAPPAPLVVTCGTITTTSVEFTWNDNGADSYDIVISIDGGPAITSNQTATTYTESGLSVGTPVTITVTPLGSGVCGSGDPVSETCTTQNCPPLTPSIDNLATEYCNDESAFTLQATPAGGTFTGDGVTGDSFDPSAVLGSSTITYSYTDPANGCDYFVTATTMITAAPPVPTVTCGTTTSTSVSFDWTPANAAGYEISYTINGGTATTLTSNDQTLEVTGLSPQDEVTISVSAIGTAPCGNSAAATQLCTADDCPTLTPTINFLDPEYCQDAPAITLAASPAGGSFSGPGVSGDQFDPGSVPAGPTTITYDYTDPANGCTYQATETIEVVAPLAAVVVNCGVVTTNSVEFVWNDVNADSYDVTISVDGGTPTTFNQTTTGHTETGLATGATVSITVVPLSSGVCGNGDPATENCTAQNCPPLTPTFDDLNTNYCSDEPAFTLTATPAGGSFSGDGVSGDSFDPATVAGSSTIVSYTYIDPANGCDYTISQTVDLTAPPVAPVVQCGTTTTSSVEFVWNDTGAATYEVTVIVDGGTPNTFTQNTTGYTETGLAINTTVNISVVSVGTASCGNSAAGTASCISSNCPPLTTTIDGLPAEVCSDAGAVALNATPAGGVFGGPGVSGNNFDPVAAGSGTHVLTYDYTDPSNGCTYAASATIIVEDPLAPILIDCGITTTSSVEFIWNDVGADSYDVNYTINGANPINTNHLDTIFAVGGLSVSDAVEITVIPLNSGICGNGAPAVRTCTASDCGPLTTQINGLAAEYCSTDAPFTLMGDPAGGTFSGPGVSGTSFDPGAANAGSNTITYDYTDPATGCDYSTSVSVAITDPLAPVVVSCGTSTTNSVEFLWNDVGADSYDISYTINGGTALTDNVLTDNYVMTGLSVNDEVTITVTPIGSGICGNGAPVSELCTASDCAPQTVTLTGLDTEYCSDNPVVILSGTPAGGSFSGPGVSGNSFDPAGLTGPITILYEYTDPATGCVYSTTASTTVSAPLAPLTVICDGGDDTSVSFSWNDNGAAMYQISYLLPGATTPIDEVTTGTSYQITGLSANDPVDITVTAMGGAPCGNSAPASTTCFAQDCPDVTVTIDNLDAAYCNDETAFTLTGSPSGGTFTINGQTVLVFDAALYTGTTVVAYEYTDASNGCMYQATQTVQVSPAPGAFEVNCTDQTQTSLSFSWTAAANVTTYDVVVLLNGTASDNFATDQLNHEQTGLQPGDEVTLEVTPIGSAICGNGATQSATCQTDDCTPPEGDLLVSAAAICLGDSTELTINLTGTGPFDVLLVENPVGSGGSGTSTLLNGIGNGETVVVSPTESVTYTIVDITDTGAFDCSVSGTIAQLTVEVSTGVEFFLNPTDYNGFGVSCPDSEDGKVDILSITGEGPFTYTWSNGSATVTVDQLGQGWISVLVDDALGCGVTDSVFLDAPPELELMVEMDPPTCFGDEDGLITLAADNPELAPYLYSFNNGPFTPIDQVGNLATGSYDVAVQDVNGCEYTQSIFLEEPNELFVDLGSDETIHLGDSIQLFPQASTADSIGFVWTEGATLSCDTCMTPWAMPLETTVYGLTIFDPNGCEAVDFLQIIVESDVRAYVPTGFSPNGDGSNDVLFVQTGPEVVRIKEFRVYDRWGEMMFSAEDFLPNDPTRGWDGTFRGKTMNPAVFIYYAILELTDGREVMIKGDAALLR